METFLAQHWLLVIKLWALLSLTLLFIFLQCSKLYSKIEDMTGKQWEIVLIMSVFPVVLVALGLIILLTFTYEILEKIASALKCELLKERSWRK